MPWGFRPKTLSAHRSRGSGGGVCGGGSSGHEEGTAVPCRMHSPVLYRMGAAMWGDDGEEPDDLHTCGRPRNWMSCFKVRMRLGFNFNCVNCRNNWTHVLSGMKIKNPPFSHPGSGFGCRSIPYIYIHIYITDVDLHPDPDLGSQHDGQQCQICPPSPGRSSCPSR